MEPDYAAVRLLEHGPLLRRDFYAITGWPIELADAVLHVLVVRGRLVIQNEWGAGGDRGARYWLAEHAPLELQPWRQRMARQMMAS